jgi:hypothetical protein
MDRRQAIAREGVSRRVKEHDGSEAQSRYGGGSGKRFIRVRGGDGLNFFSSAF